jgi:ATP-binding cassette subfamily B protein
VGVLLDAIRAHRGYALLGVGVGLAWSVGKLAAPVFIRRVLDLGIRDGNPGALGRAVASLLVIGVVGAALAGTRRYLAQSVAARIETDLRARLFSHLLRLDLGFHARWPAGQLVSRSATDLQQIQQPFVNIPITVSNAVMLLGATWLSLRIDPSLTLVALGPALLVFLVARRFTVRLGPRAHELQQSLGGLASTIEETIAGIRAIKGLGLESVERQRVGRQTEAVYSAAVHLNRVRARFMPMLELLPAVGLIGVLWFGGQRVLAGRMSVGSLVQVSYYVVMLVGPLRMTGVTVAQLQRAVVSADRIAALLAVSPRIAARVPGSSPPPPLPLAGPEAGTGGEIRFEEVEFGYGDDPPLLRGLELHVRAGETVALVGATGAGKSTLAALIARFYDVRAGRITLDGQDVRDLPLGALRASIGMVFEDAFLFSGSVRDNIAFSAGSLAASAPGAAQADVEAAAVAAGAHDFIVGLEHGYDTRVGERGLSLSGGQRQRITLARALLANPRVLILDAATDAVDAAKEEEIRQALLQVRGGRTTIVVAHRPATLRLADRVLVLEGGRIAEAGTHAALLSRSARYRQILASGRDGAQTAPAAGAPRWEPSPVRRAV